MANIDNQFFQKNTEPPNKTYSYYTIFGSHDFLDEDDKPRANSENKNVVAKSVQTDDKPLRYYIKVGTYGKIFNPIGLFSEGNNTKFLSKIGKKQFEFKEVNYKIFNLYLNFLRSKNIAWLNNAERELT